jgi:hypothetical protein
MVQLSILRRVSKIFNIVHINTTTSTTTQNKNSSLSSKKSLKNKKSKSNKMHEIIEETNNVQNLIYMGECYLFGKNGIEKDEEKAVKYFKTAASRTCSEGVTQAKAILGFCYEFGLGVPENFKSAEELYICAANDNSGLAQARLAFLRRYGRPSVKIDRTEAENWLNRVNQRGSQAIQWLINAATVEQHPAAIYCLGVCYHDGIGVEKNPSKAVFYYKRSAELGQSRGEGILGYCYGEGFGVEKNDEVAFYWYYKAAQKK